MVAALKKVEFTQPGSFAFTDENLVEAKKIIAKYPEGKQQSAVMPLLVMAQKQHDNWLPEVAIHYVAEMLGMPYMRAYEVASFYSMYNMQPMGTYHIQVCTTTPCWLRGSDNVVRACKDELGIKMGESTEDGKFTLQEVECLGACVNAPMIEVTCSQWDKYFEDLDYENTRAVLRDLKRGEAPKEGSQTDRNSSEPQNGPTVLEAQQAGWKAANKEAK